MPANELKKEPNIDKAFKYYHEFSDSMAEYKALMTNEILTLAGSDGVLEKGELLEKLPPEEAKKLESFFKDKDSIFASDLINHLEEKMSKSAIDAAYKKFAAQGFTLNFTPREVEQKLKSQPETSQLLPKGKTVEEVVKAMDTDGNQQISLQELIKGLAGMMQTNSAMPTPNAKSAEPKQK